MSSKLTIGFEASSLAQSWSGPANYARTLLKDLSRFAPEHAYVLYVDENVDERSLEGLAKLGTVRPVGAQSGLARLFGAALPGAGDLTLFHSLSGRVPKGLKCPVIATVDDLSFIHFPDGFTWGERRALRRDLQDTIQRADMLLATSDMVRDALITYLGVPESKVLFIRQTTSRRYVRENIPTQEIERVLSGFHLPKRFVLTVGGFSWRHNVDTLIRGFAQLKSRAPDVPLLVIGREGEAEEMSAVYQACKGCGPRVRVMHHVSDRDLPALYAAAECYVRLPFSDGACLTIKEALTAGTPVVAPDTAAFRGMVGDAGLLVNADDEKAIGDAIGAILSDSETAARMRAATSRQATQFGPEVVTRAVLDLYDRVARKQAAA